METFTITAHGMAYRLLVPADASPAEKRRLANEHLERLEQML